MMDPHQDRSAGAQPSDPIAPNGAGAGAGAGDEAPPSPAARAAGVVDDRQISAFRKVPRTGVIYVTTEAARLGFRAGVEADEQGWCNLGQGQP